MKKRTLLLFLVLVLEKTLLGQTIERIEPSNWWAGMERNKITLLIYGDNVGGLNFTTNYRGITHLETIAVPNKNYLFVSLELAEDIKPGIAQLIFQGPLGTLQKDFPILKRDKGSKDRQGFDASDAIYLIQADRFANGNPKNDSTPDTKEKRNRTFKGGRHGGDIQGIMNHLEYVNNLGFTFIWTCPMIENDMPNYSYHGYAATDLYKIDPRFGSNEQYKQFVQEAADKGIGVIKDVVLNHLGSQHWFVKDKPTPDWLNDPGNGEFVQTNHMKVTLLDPYAAEVDRMNYTDGWFVDTMPDLNQRNELMAQYLIQNSIWWIEYAGIRGIRVDTWSYSDKDFLNEWTKAIMTEYPNFNIVGEEWISVLPLTSYWQKGKSNPDGFEPELPSVMDFAIAERLKEALTEEKTWASPWRKVYESVGQDFLFPNPMNLMIFPDNHDMDRVYTALGEDFDHWKLMITLFATMRGIPQIYYGTEILMTNENSGDHGEIRADFPGGWPGDKVNAFTGKGLTKKQKEAQELLKTLFTWRRTSKAIAEGKMLHYIPEAQEDVYTFFRYTEDELVMVCLSRNPENVTLDMERFKQIIPAKVKAKDIINNRELVLDKSLTLQPKQALVLEIQR